MFDAFDRSGTGSSKWARAGEGRIALGLADMDLPGPPAIGAALAARARHPAFGYTVCDPAGRATVAAWYRRRHGVEVDPDWVLLLPFGPRTALRLLLDAAPRTGPAVFGTPEWGGFDQLCRASGLPHHAVPLDRADGYRLPLDTVARHRPGVILLSSPHNPTGLLRSAADIRALAELAADGGGLLVSDEVHGDLVHPAEGRAGAESDERQASEASAGGWAPPARGRARRASVGTGSRAPGGGQAGWDTADRHPVAVEVAGELRGHTVTLNSVGKTFNTSGIPSCFALVPDPALRERLIERMAGYGLWEGGLLEQTVQHAALTESDEWLGELLAHLVAARELALAALGPAVAARPQASYLLWLDGAGLGSRERILLERGVELSDGADFGLAGNGFLRLNFALPLARLQAAITRLTCTEEL